VAQGVHVRVWAPDHQMVSVVLEADGREVSLKSENNGYFSGALPGAAAGTRYHFRLDEGPDLSPDPASRFQPEGPHGPSEVVDPQAFRWRNPYPPPRQNHQHIIYEMHIGTFTGEGTWAAAMQQLRPLADLGITLLEIMPIHEFPGEFGWGYDGVDMFAPYHCYGSPKDFRRFIDAAHGLGLGVILDVVYNHLGPDGNYLEQFSKRYFTDRYPNDWGRSTNFDGDDAGGVREFFTANAAMWIDEYHLDGLRLDATQSIIDNSSGEHILAAIARCARAAADGRVIFIVAENEPQDVRLIRKTDQGGFGFDAMWNDDLHHSATVALTGRSEAYYTDYCGSPQELISAAKYGFLYQGQWYAWQKQPRGTPALDMAPECFVAFIQNHDQVANSRTGARAHQLTDPGTYRAMTALFLLLPAIPMLFQGQEFAASSPFLYFADHKPELAAAVTKGRKKFLGQFPSMAAPEAQRILDDPSDRKTFERSKLDFSERERHRDALQLHSDLIRLRTEDPVLSRAIPSRLDGAVLSSSVFLLRWITGSATDRLLIVNLGSDLHLLRAPEPLLAPPNGDGWRLVWSSEQATYAGSGTPDFQRNGEFHFAGRSAILLIPSAESSSVPRFLGSSGGEPASRRQSARVSRCDVPRAGRTERSISPSTRRRARTPDDCRRGRRLSPRNRGTVENA
jgi:maltooligosyltrehalose trehalohydrolase